MFAPHAKIIPDAAVLTTTLADEGVVLLHLQTNHYYSLNVTGAQIWQGIDEGATVGEISQHLVDLYAISQAEAGVAVRSLLQELTAARLVQITPMAD